MLEFEIKGLNEVTRNVLTFPDKLQKKAMRGAMRAGGMVIVKIARKKIKKKSGRLARSVRTMVKYRNGRWTATVIAGRNRPGKPDDPYYALMVERGTEAHDIRPKRAKSLFLAGLMRTQVKHPGSAPAPFLGPALEEGAEQALEAIRTSLMQSIGNFTYDKGMI